MSETVSYETGSNCTSRNYTITPKNLFSQLELYPSNRSESTIHLTVNITFESCPIGFEQSNFTGECICDHRLWQYTNSCDIERQTILRNATRTFWIGASYMNGTLEGFIHRRYCPFDYTVPRRANRSTATILTSNATPTILGCCVGSAKMDLVLCWAAPSVRSVVTIT